MLLTSGLERLYSPAALWFGPMAAASVMAVRGVGLTLSNPAMHVAQGIVGLMIATILPASLRAEIAAKWPIVPGGTLSTIIERDEEKWNPVFLANHATTEKLEHDEVSIKHHHALATSALGWGLARSGLLPGTTAIWSLSPGAASVMTGISQDYAADIRLAAFMQYLRVACVALVARFFGVAHGTAPGIIWFSPMPALGVPGTIALAAGLAFAGLRLRLPGGSVILPMLAGLALQKLGLIKIYLPP